MSQADIERIKQARRQILEGLNLMYPGAMRTASVYRTNVSIDPAYDWTLFEKDLFYLKEKGYVEFVDDKLGLTQSLDKRVVKLTASGKDIADQTMNDPSLDI